VVAGTLLNEKNNAREKVDAFVANGYEKIHKQRFEGIVGIIEDPVEYKKLVPRSIPRYVVVDENAIIRYQGTGDTAGPVAVRVAEDLAQKFRESLAKKSRPMPK
jgi:hypothetical protein